MGHIHISPTRRGKLMRITDEGYGKRGSDAVSIDVNLTNDQCNELAASLSENAITRDIEDVIANQHGA